MILRPYQQELDHKVDQAWASGARNVLMRLPTGGGKTVMLAEIVRRHQGASCVIAHRDNLIMQLSLALAEAGIPHNIIAQRDVRRAISLAHVMKLGRSFYDPGARCSVASVRTLRAVKGLDHWFPQVTLWIVDEGHHLVVDNEWHEAISRFTNPHCRGLLPTATPERADGKGLGSHADGVADVMVQGPSERWLIDEGYLTDYRIVVRESDVVTLLEKSKVAASGDYSPKVLRDAAAASHIVGDVVGEYLKYASGRLWLTFASDVVTAVEMAQAYNAAGVRAETLTGDTPYGLRLQLLRQFEARQILQLVVVDVVSEGFDLPAIEGASDGRKTESLANYRQRFGRTLRPMWSAGSGLGSTHRYDLDTRAGRLASIAEGPKPKAWWIDQVGNVQRHLLPDTPRNWTLDRRGSRRGGGGDGIPLRICLGDGCFQPYERFRLCCPYCGEPVPPPAARSSPAAVEGDLVELDAATLAALRQAVVAVQMTTEAFRVDAMLRGVPAIGVMSQVKLHDARLQAHDALRAAMTEWTAARLAEGLRDREVHRLHYMTFGVDVLTAQTLNTADANVLSERLRAANKNLRT